MTQHNTHLVDPKRRTRAESFLGVHFDFHATPKSINIGARTTREMVEQIIDQVQPDYLQCDCKGHPGFSSYPTSIGNPAPGITVDALRIWRDVTAEHGIPLFVHYSGVWDGEAVRLHPDWAVVDAEGKISQQATSTVGPYVDELLIPQLKELNDLYNIDGVWVDGDCWATTHDYSERMRAAFAQETGIEELPRSAKDTNYHVFSAFCRAAFRRYLRHYVATLHAYNPALQLASNWAYSSMMPEAVSADVDFISGDLTLQDSINSARFDGRCMLYQGKPWDLMSWGFSGTFGGENGYPGKSVQQLQQEAATVIALGGGFQVYYPQEDDGAVRLWQMQIMREVARFCRARQDFCHHALPVPQIGLLYSQSALHYQSKRLFGEWGTDTIPFRGILQMLLDSQQVVDILLEHQLTERIANYSLIIVPEWSYLDPDIKEILLSYTDKGGKLLLVGPRTAELFSSELGIVAQEEIKDAIHWLEHNKQLTAVRGAGQRVKLPQDAIPFGRWYEHNDMTGPSTTAASLAHYGKGHIAAVYCELGAGYVNGSTSLARHFLHALVQELFPDPLVTVTGSQYVDVTVMRQHDQLMVNLVNTAGPHANKQVYVFDEIPPVGPLTISIQSTQAPTRIIQQPEGKELPYTYTNGRITLTLPSLEIHTIIAIA